MAKPSGHFKHYEPRPQSQRTETGWRQVWHITLHQPIEDRAFFDKYKKHRTTQETEFKLLNASGNEITVAVDSTKNPSLDQFVIGQVDDFFVWLEETVALVKEIDGVPKENYNPLLFGGQHR
jgi:hypothetical protein